MGKTEEIPVPITIDGSSLKLRIDPDEVNRIIAAAILSSGISDRIKMACEEFLSNEGTGYGDRSVKKAVQQELEKMIVEVCSGTEIRERLKERVVAHMTDEVVETYIKNLLERSANQAKRGY